MTYKPKNYLIAIVVSLFAFAAWAGEFPDSECDNREGNLINNCGWETNCWAGWHPGEDIPVDIGRDGTAHGGAYYAVIHANPNNLWIAQQNLPTVPGQTYKLSFWVRNFDPVDFVAVTWNSDGFEHVVFNSGNIAFQDWTPIVISGLYAESDDTTIAWALGNTVGDIHLDDIVLAPQE